MKATMPNGITRKPVPAGHQAGPNRYGQMKRVLSLALVLLAAALVMPGCSSSTRLTNSWVSSEKTGSVKKVMVLAMFNNNNNRALRAELEQELVRDLKAYKIDAVSAFQAYGPKTFQGMSENEALAKLQSSGVDAVLTVRLLDKNKEKTYVPGRYGFAPYPYYGGFWGYYSFYSPMVYQPGYYANTTQYSFETNLYNVNNGQLLYSAQSSSFDPTSAKSLAGDHARMIVRDLRKKNALG